VEMMEEKSSSLSSEVTNLLAQYQADPKSRLFAPLADAYRKNKKIDEAIEICKKGLALHPTYASAHLVLGKCYQEKGLFSLAREEFNQVLRIDPQNLIALKLRADVCLAQGLKEEAVGSYKLVLELDPANESVRKTLDSILIEREEKVARPEEKEIMTEEIGEEGKLVEVSKEEIPKRSTSTPISLTLAQIYTEQGFLDKALEVYRQFLLLNPSDTQIQQKITELERELRAKSKEPSPESVPPEQKTSEKGETYEALFTPEEKAELDIENVESSPKSEETDKRIEEELRTFEKWLDSLRG